MHNPEFGSLLNSVGEIVGQSKVAKTEIRKLSDMPSTYRERDVLEKGFDTLKNDLKALPLNAKTKSTTRGLLFVNYLILIVRMRLINQMRETGFLKNNTVEKLLLELEKIKKIQLANGEIIVTEVTKSRMKFWKN